MKRLIFITALSCVALCGSANATTINFNSLEQAGSSLINVSDPYVESGYKITDNGLLFSAQQSYTEYAGSAGLHERQASGSITLSRVDGQSFDLTSIDLSVLNPQGTSPPVTFTGFFAGGGSITETFQPLTFGFTTFTFTGFSGLADVEWFQGTGDAFAHQFDNIVVNAAVPGPTVGAGATSFALGALFLGWLARRRGRVAV